jgi:dihydropteroate synthase
MTNLKLLDKKNRLNFGCNTCLMGVLNITPDSFFDGGRYLSSEDAAQRAIEIQNNGADIIDIGAESSRPGSATISQEEELRRIIPVLEKIKNIIHIPVSLDTSRSETIKKASEIMDIAIINDIYSCRRDPAVTEMAIQNDSYLVLMHMQGNPENMQNKPIYSDIIFEIMNFFEERISFVTSKGLKEERIILDPGIGFGKNLEDNLTILKNLKRFKVFGFPLLIGVSRKSFIGSITGASAEERLWGTASAVSASVLYGADIIRAHDVAEMKDVIAVAQILRTENGNI